MMREMEEGLVVPRLNEQSNTNSSRTNSILHQILRALAMKSPTIVPLSPRTRRMVNMESDETRRVTNLEILKIPFWVRRDGLKAKIIEESKTVHLQILVETLLDCKVSLADHKGRELFQLANVAPAHEHVTTLDLDMPNNGKPLKLSLTITSSSSSSSSSPNQEISLVLAMLVGLAKDNNPTVHLIRQYIHLPNKRLCINEIFNQPSINGDNLECVICLSSDRNTIALPCRHMCICSTCAHTLSDEHGSCPLCRQHLSGLIIANSSSTRASSCKLL